MMFKRYAVLCLVVVFCAMVIFRVNAQDTTAGGNVRVVQIFYTNADVYIDDELVVTDLAFTVATDFIPLETGTHTITIAPTDQGMETGASTPLEVSDNHHYTIVTMGKFEDGTPNLVTIDETEAFANADLQGNNAIIIQNVPEAIPVDVWFADELKIENLAFGGYGTASAPLGQFPAQAVIVGQRDNVVFESQYFAVPGTVSLAYLSGSFPDGINRTFFTTTSASMYDYLTAHAALENSKLTTLYDLIASAGLNDKLAGETPYTLFAPTNDAFAALPEGTLDTLKSDPAALAEFLGYHLVEGYWGPYELTGEHSLPSLQGKPLEVVFQPVETPLTVNGVRTGLQHRVGNGVIYLIDSVLLPPQ